MEKPVQTSFALAAPIVRRWSPRAFRPVAVEREKVHTLLEAARWAPSAYNEQPWRFVVALRDTPEFFPMLACLAEPNQVWARQSGALLAGVVLRNFTHNGKPNRWFHHDLGLAVENLLLQATLEGLFGHPMAGFSPAQVQETFQIPQEYDPLVMIALGYPGDPEALPEDLREREYEERTRKEHRELFFEGAWGNPFAKA
jgi:Nitroreductase